MPFRRGRAARPDKEPAAHSVSWHRQITIGVLGYPQRMALSNMGRLAINACPSCRLHALNRGLFGTIRPELRNKVMQLRTVTLTVAALVCLGAASGQPSDTPAT